MKNQKYHTDETTTKRQTKKTKIAYEKKKHIHTKQQLTNI